MSRNPLHLYRVRGQSAGAHLAPREGCLKSRRRVRKQRGSGGWAGMPLLLAAAIFIWHPSLGNSGQDPPHVPIPGGLRGKSCFECHIAPRGGALPSLERPRKYTLAAAYETYLQSPHGRLRTLGDERAPMCEDCHLTREWTDILPRELPNSPIHPRNLPRLCARCHGDGMRTANVAAGSMHLELSHRSLRPGAALEVRYGFLPGLTKLEQHYYLGPFDITAYVNWFFILITVGTLSAFSAYLVIDLIRKLMERHERQQSGTPGARGNHKTD